MPTLRRRALLANAAYAVDGREAAAAALTAFRTTKADFADCLVAARCTVAGCAGTATLDRAMKSLPAVVLL